MNWKRRTINLVHQSWLWLKQRNTLPVLFCILLVAVLSAHQVPAKDQGDGDHHIGATKLTPTGSNTQYLDFDHLASLPEDSEDSDESGEEENGESLDETEDGPDDFWKTCYRAFLAIGAFKEETVFSSITQSLKHRKILPLFILYCSWKSFLS